MKRRTSRRSADYCEAEENTMASLIDRIKHFAKSPQAQQARARAQQAARDPRNKAKVRSLLARLRGGRRH